MSSAKTNSAPPAERKPKFSTLSGLPVDPVYARESLGTWDPETELGYPGEFPRSEEHTSELQSRLHLVCRLLLEKKKDTPTAMAIYGGDRNLQRLGLGSGRHHAM